MASSKRNFGLKKGWRPITKEDLEIVARSYNPLMYPRSQGLLWLFLFVFFAVLGLLFGSIRS